MIFWKNCKGILGLFLAAVLLTACAAETEADQPLQLEYPAEGSYTLQDHPAEEEVPVSTLYDDIFLPFARTGGTSQDFQALAQSFGFSVLAENGVLLVYDRDGNDSFLRAVPAETEVEELVFSLTVQDVQRQVRATQLGDPQYATGVSNYQEGTPVSTEEAVRAYLTGPVTLEEKTPPDIRTALRLFLEVFLPLAEGELSKDLEELKGSVEEMDFSWQTGEGQYYIMDIQHPENYIWLEVTGVPARVYSCGFSLHWEGQDYQVCTIFLEDGSVLYYKDLAGDAGGQQVSGLDYLKEFIYTARR